MPTRASIDFLVEPAYRAELAPSKSGVDVTSIDFLVESAYRAELALSKSVVPFAGVARLRRSSPCPSC